jgi:hypothetical protein
MPMPPDTQARGLTDEQLQEVLRLIEGADSLE